MDHDTARVLDVLLATICLLLAGAIIVSAARRAEPLVATAVRLIKDATA